MNKYKQDCLPFEGRRPTSIIHRHAFMLHPMSATVGPPPPTIPLNHYGHHVYVHNSATATIHLLQTAKTRDTHTCFYCSCDPGVQASDWRRWYASWMCMFFQSCFMELTRSLTSVLEKKLDASQQWCLRRLLHISHLQRVTNTEVLRWTNQTQLSIVLCDRRLRLFGRVARSDAQMDHWRALRAVISELLSHWRRPPGRPRQSWT